MAPSVRTARILSLWIAVVIAVVALWGGPTGVRDVDAAGSGVIVFRDVLSWESDILEQALTDLGVMVDVDTSDMFASISLAPYKLAIVVSDQPTGLYEAYQASQERFTTYVRGGGRLLLSLAGWGWSGGDASSVLTLDGVRPTLAYDETNCVSNQKHFIATAVRGCWDGSYASHADLSGGVLTGKAGPGSIIAVDSAGLPTLLGYTFGKGRVVVNGTTFEFRDHYMDPNRPYQRLLKNSLRYLLGMKLPSTPTVTTVSPARGLAVGGNPIQLTGKNLLTVSAVTFGDVPAVSFQIDSDTQITAVSPSGTPPSAGAPKGTGQVDVQVVNDGGFSKASKSTKYVWNQTVNLPVPTGQTVYVSQATNNKNGTHKPNSKDAWAYDFAQRSDAGALQSFPVAAAANGTVLAVQTDQDVNDQCKPGNLKAPKGCWTSGNFILIDHGDSTSSLYLHFAKDMVYVQPGDFVSNGQVIGMAGSTGLSGGIHLHFAIGATPAIVPCPRVDRTDPTCQASLGWWWTQSVPSSFVDAAVLATYMDGMPTANPEVALNRDDFGATGVNSAGSRWQVTPRNHPPATARRY